MDTTYTKKLYNFAKNVLGAGFTKTESEFIDALSDKEYVDKLYTFAKDSLGVGFTKTPDEFSTLALNESMSLEGEANAPIKRQREMQSQMQPAIEKAREEELRSTTAGQLFPYTAKSMAQTGDKGISLAAAKDVASYVPRSLMDLWNLTGGDPSDLNKTSEEYSKEGKLFKSIATSPLLAPNIAAGVLTGGMSLPAQIAITGATGVVSGALFDDDYGAGSAALDIGTGFLPVLGPILGDLINSRSIKTIKGALSKAGIIGTDADEIARQISVGGYKEADKMAKDLIERGATQIANDIEPQVIPLEAFDPTAIELSASSMPPPRYAMKTSEGDPIFKPYRTLQEVEEVKAMLPEITSKVTTLNKLFENGTLTEDAYKKHITDLLRDYSNVPELVDVITSNVTKDVGDLAAMLREGMSDIDLAFSSPDIMAALDGIKAGANKALYPDIDLPSNVGLQDLMMGERLRQVKPPTTSPLTGLGIGDITLGGLRKLGQKVITQPTPALSNAQEALFRSAATTLPSVSLGLRREYFGSEQPLFQ